MKKLACFILSYDITRGMKSIGPKGLLRSNKSKELINCQIENIKHKNIDTYVMLGFGIDKIKKKIEHQKNVHIIKNDLYDSANHGYAIELILQQYNTNKYDGCIIINNGILFDNDIKYNLLNSDRNASKIYYFNKNNNYISFPIGFTIVDSRVQHMFFNLTDNIWSEILYIDNSSIKTYNNLYSQSMRNMFLFEIINKSIDLGINYLPIKTKHNSVIKISSVKDSNRIKETI